MLRARALRAARVSKGLSQTAAAERLGVSQPYLAMLERGHRRVRPELERRAAKLYGVHPTAVAPAAVKNLRRNDAATLAKDLAGLGYPGLAYLRPRRWTPKNPSEVLLVALARDELEPRLVEALPWVVLRYSDLDWTWVVREAKIRNLQNRLGFVVSLARDLAERGADHRRIPILAALEAELEPSRLAREDTLCQGSMTDAERRLLTDRRPNAARHWNLLTDWSPDVLRYTACDTPDDQR